MGHGRPTGGCHGIIRHTAENSTPCSALRQDPLAIAQRQQHIRTPRAPRSSCHRSFFCFFFNTLRVYTASSAQHYSGYTHTAVHYHRSKRRLAPKVTENSSTESPSHEALGEWKVVSPIVPSEGEQQRSRGIRYDDSCQHKEQAQVST